MRLVSILALLFTLFVGECVATSGQFRLRGKMRAGPSLMMIREAAVEVVEQQMHHASFVAAENCHQVMSEETKAPYMDQIEAAEDALDEKFSYVMFFGYARSGHSLVGSLLDAHPNMLISNELSVLHYEKSEKKHWDEEKLVENIIANSVVCSSKRVQANYDYTIPDSYQGKFEDKVLAIGDKKGSASTMMFHDWEDGISRLQRLQSALGKSTSHKMVFVHVVRNPYDMLATRGLRRWFQQTYPDASYNAETILKHAPIEVDLSTPVRVLMKQIKLNAKLRDSITDILGENVRWHDMKYEDLIADPVASLSSLCVDILDDDNCSSDYLSTATSIVMTSISTTRHLVQWTDEQKAYVADQLKDVEYFKDYSFDQE